MHGWAQERLQIYLRSLDKVKKSNEPAVEFGRRFAMARPLFFERAEARRAKVVSGAAPENSALSWREESKALCLQSFVLKTVLSVWRQLSRMSHVLGFEDVVELGLGKQVFLGYRFVDATVGERAFLWDSRALFVAESGIEASDRTVGIWHIV